MNQNQDSKHRGHLSSSPPKPTNRQLRQATNTLLQYARNTNGEDDWKDETEIALYLARQLTCSLGAESEWFNLSLGMLNGKIDWTTQDIVNLVGNTRGETNALKIRVAQALLDTVDDGRTCTVTIVNTNEDDSESEDPEDPEVSEVSEDDLRQRILDVIEESGEDTYMFSMDIKSALDSPRDVIKPVINSLSDEGVIRCTTRGYVITDTDDTDDSDEDAYEADAGDGETTPADD